MKTFKEYVNEQRNFKFKNGDRVQVGGAKNK